MPAIAIPVDAKSCYERLHGDILQYADTIARLEQELLKFPQLLNEALDKNEFLDTDNAEYCFAKCEALLALCQKDPSAAHVPHALAAVAYFVCEDDAIDDFTTLDGFKDDRGVIEAVIAHYQLNI